MPRVNDIAHAPQPCMTDEPGSPRPGYGIGDNFTVQRDAAVSRPGNSFFFPEGALPRCCYGSLGTKPSKLRGPTLATRRGGLRDNPGIMLLVARGLVPSPSAGCSRESLKSPLPSNARHRWHGSGFASLNIVTAPAGP